MKLIYTILFFISYSAKATIYYVSNTGSDSNNGTSTGTAWQTIAKVNAASLSPDDRIRLNAGSSWNEQLVFPSSGTLGHPIIIESYGVGAMPVITGFQTLTGWTNVGSVWSSTFSNSVHYQNTVLVNGVFAGKGRYPNYGWLTFTSHSGNNQITGGLSGTPNYTGGEVVVRANRWTVDKGFITNQTGGQITFSPANYYGLIDGWGYYIQNIPSVLDTLNEWCYDTTTKVIKVYASSQPTVYASAIDTLVNLANKSYLTFDGISFQGANISAFELSSSHHITITNCDIQYSGQNGISGKTSNKAIVSNCNIRDSWNDGIILFDFATAFPDSDTTTIYNNTIANTGTIAGMCKGGFHTCISAMVFGDHATITNNLLTNQGYMGMYFYGDTCIVKYNYVDSFCIVKDDGGGIYTFNALSPTKTGSIVRSNIVLNGFNSTAGTAIGTPSQTFGIYFDDETNGAIIDSNTVYNGGVDGIHFHNASHIAVTNNTLLSNKTNLGLDFGSSTPHYIDFRNNISVTTEDVTSLLVERPAFFSSMDTNHYSNRQDTTKIFQANAYSPFWFSLSRWQDTTGLDLHSTRTPTGITAAAPIIRYNPTTEVIAYGLSGTYYDMIGGVYTNVVIVQPYQSVILFKATTNIIIPNTGVLRSTGISKVKQL